VTFIASMLYYLRPAVSHSIIVWFV